jgi:hypothetical protein
MANDEHVAILKKGVAAWNAWRDENLPWQDEVRTMKLPGLAKWAYGDSGETAWNRWCDKNYPGRLRPDLRRAKLRRRKLSGADLSVANLREASLHYANLQGANLQGANLIDAMLGGANLTEADLTQADLTGANLSTANLTQAKLIGADLRQAILYRANLSGARLRDASLAAVTLVETELTNADLTGCSVYGVSAWGLKLWGAKQQNLIITPEDSPVITVDDIEVAQFIYLLLHNPKIRDVIDTIGKKAVLILGRFTPERKAVLDALREELRQRNYLPILFDFDKPASQDLTATVSTLAHLARFIIADLSDPSSIPYELATVVPTTPVPVQPILLSGCSEFAMFQDLRRRHHWVLPTHRYDTPGQLIADLDTWLIRPAETKVLELRGR